jgi:hypothetical protein
VGEILAHRLALTVGMIHRELEEIPPPPDLLVFDCRSELSCLSAAGVLVALRRIVGVNGALSAAFARRS